MPMTTVELASSVDPDEAAQLGLIIVPGQEAFL